MSASREKLYFNKLAEVYDEKTASGLNKKLARDDNIFLNHSGIVLSSRDISRVKGSGLGEDGELDLMHRLEKNLVSFGMKYLGGASGKKRVLDAGCGAGGSAILINRKLKYRIDGYTISKKQVLFANRAAKEYGVSDKVKFHCGNILDLAHVRNNIFDAIWACESTEHIPAMDLGPMFSEFSRVTKPSARMVVIAWTSRSGLHKDGERIKYAIDKHYITDIHSKNDYTRAAMTAGWQLKRAIDLTKKSLPYWEFRHKSRNATSSEKYFIKGYKNNSLSYTLFVFDKIPAEH